MLRWIRIPLDCGLWVRHDVAPYKILHILIIQKILDLNFQLHVYLSAHAFNRSGEATLTPPMPLYFVMDIFLWVI
jgi:hypothetical protein